MLSVRRRTIARACGPALLVLALLLTGCSRPAADAPTPAHVAARPEPDAIVVGAGLAGLSTALEIARGGGRVVVVDMASVFGGHAVMAMGDLCLVDTPAQHALGISDSPELAFADIMRWGRSPMPEWVRFYAENSRELVHDWLEELGVEYEAVLKGQGTENSVPRVHRTRGRGVGLVGPVMRACLEHPGITFAWHRRVERLLVDGGRVVGVAGSGTRTGLPFELRAGAVVLATGGFQNNLDMVRQFWTGEAPFPPRFLAGSGVHSTGGGHRLAEVTGAALVDMERQMNLASGIPDPRYPDGRRGLNARPYGSLWVNATGRRFCAEFEQPDEALAVLLRQPQATYWAIFDEESKRGFLVSGSDWGSFAQIEQSVLRNPGLTKAAGTLAELAVLAGLPGAELEATVARYNQMVEGGSDDDFGRWGPGRSPRSPPQRLVHAPYYAVQFFPLTRKSMGGVAVDLSCRVRTEGGHTIPGLYAVGELTGSALINGDNGMSGMFLGPCILMGRVAGRSILAESTAGEGGRPAEAAAPRPALTARSTTADTAACRQCHDLPRLVEQARPAWWHFEKVHRTVLAKGWDCAACHADVPVAADPAVHRIDWRNLAQSCVRCHVAEEP